MSTENLSPERLEHLKSIRLRRRELEQEASNDFRELLAIANAAATRRSEKRHRFMLLAGGIAGVAVPILLQNTAGVNPTLVRLGSALFLTTIIVGAIFDALDERRTGSILLRASTGSRTTTQLAFAEDLKLISARPGEGDPDGDRLIEEARAKAKAADEELAKAATKFAKVSAVEAALFFGAFVLGLVVLLLAVGTAAKQKGLAVEHAQVDQAPTGRESRDGRGWLVESYEGGVITVRHQGSTYKATCRDSTSFNNAQSALDPKNVVVFPSCDLAVELVGRMVQPLEGDQKNADGWIVVMWNFRDTLAIRSWRDATTPWRMDQFRITSVAAER